MSEADATDVDDDRDSERADTDHLDDLDAGAGCAEIWEHLSERREHASSD